MNTPAEVAKNYVPTGVGKATAKASRLFVSAIMAGIFIALAAVGATTVAVSVGAASLGKLLAGVVFPTGLAMVLIAGSELFTGNTLIVISVLERKVKVSGMLRNWAIVYAGNFVGSVLIALLVVYGHTFSLFGNGLAAAAVSIADGKTAMTFTDAIIRGILCNFLVCIAVWMAYAGKTVVCKVAALYLPIMLFILSGYEHSIANMYYIPAGIFAAAEYGISTTTNWGNFIASNLIPVTIGNIIGGGGFVGLSYWFVHLKGNKSK